MCSLKVFLILKITYIRYGVQFRFAHCQNKSYGMVTANYMLTAQSDINEKMRAILNDILLRCTTSLTCNMRRSSQIHIFKLRFLANQNVARKQLQLFGLVIW